MRTRNHPSIWLLAAFLILAFPAAGHADDLFRLFPEVDLNGLYSTNIPLRSHNAQGDFAGTLVAGFYLDYTSAARYTSLHYDTFAQLFAHQTRFDRAGEGQFFRATDDEHLSDTTKLRFTELFYRDSPTAASVITGDEGPQFNSVAASLLLANDRAAINQFTAYLTHYWGHNWSSSLSLHQTTLWNNGGGSSNVTFHTSYDQSVRTVTEYHFSDHFSLGPGYRFFDFRFSSPGRPGEEAHWPFVRAAWQPTENLYLSAIAGVVVSYAQGNSRQAVNVGGEGLLEYHLQRTHLKIYGGQQPELTAGAGGAGNTQEVRGELLYDFTRRLTGRAGAGFFDSHGTGFNGQLISWGVGTNYRANKWLSAHVNFVQLHRIETTSRQFLPVGTQNGREAVGDYFVVGFDVSFEALRWSWQ
jgi:hypothetical protein